MAESGAPVYVQELQPVAGSLGLSALTAALPLVIVLVLLGGVRMKAHLAGLTGLLAAVLVACLAYGMPVGQTLSSAAQGAAFGLFPILWIVVNALWAYRMTVRTRHFDVLRRSFGRLSDDPRIQALVVAFCFGALLEALAGFGAPVAICSVMLVALGFDPVRAAVVSLVANTAPVAFGAMGTPVVTLAQVTGLPLESVASVVGRQTPLLALVVPLVLVGLVDGRRGLRETWLPALACGIAFAVAQFAASNYVSAQLADIGAALAGAGALVAVPHTRVPAPEAVRASVLTGARSEELDERDPRREVVRAYAPYALVVAIFSVAQIPAAKDWLAGATRTYDWPFLDVVNADGDPVGGNVFTWPIVSTGGTLVLLAGMGTAAVLGVHARVALKEWAATVHELRFAILTVTSVLALAYVMNLSGRCDDRPLRRGGRRRTRLPVTRPRLVRRRRLRLGHLRQRALRRPPGHRRPRVGPLARTPGRRQQLGRGARQDDLPAEPHHRLRRRRPRRPRGRPAAQGAALEHRPAARDVPRRGRPELTGAGLDASVGPL
jgi:lactate permease